MSTVTKNPLIGGGDSYRNIRQGDIGGAGDDQNSLMMGGGGVVTGGGAVGGIDTHSSNDNVGDASSRRSTFRMRASSDEPIKAMLAVGETPKTEEVRARCENISGV